jgi:hypothetical protein
MGNCVCVDIRAFVIACEPALACGIVGAAAAINIVRTSPGSETESRRNSKKRFDAARHTGQLVFAMVLAGHGYR